MTTESELKDIVRQLEEENQRDMQRGIINERFNHKKKMAGGISLGLILLSGVGVFQLGRYVSQNTTSLNPYNNTTTAHYEELLLAEKGLELLANSPPSQDNMGINYAEVFRTAHENAALKVQELEKDPNITTYRDWNQRTRNLAENTMYGSIGFTLLTLFGELGLMGYYSRQRRRELAKVRAPVEISSPSP